VDDYRWVKPVQLGSEPIRGHAIPIEPEQSEGGEPLLAQFYTAKCGRLVLLSVDDQDLTDDVPLCEGCVEAVMDPEQAVALAEALPMEPASGAEVVPARADPVVVLVRKLPEEGPWPYKVNKESQRLVHVQPMRLDLPMPPRFRAYCGFSWIWDEVETLDPSTEVGAFCPHCFSMWAVEREAARRAGGTS
jgi:hypothetical protein